MIASCVARDLLRVPVQSLEATLFRSQQLSSSVCITTSLCCHSLAPPPTWCSRHEQRFARHLLRFDELHDDCGRFSRLFLSDESAPDWEHRALIVEAQPFDVSVASDSLQKLGALHLLDLHAGAGHGARWQRGNWQAECALRSGIRSIEAESTTTELNWGSISDSAAICSIAFSTQPPSLHSDSIIRH